MSLFHKLVRFARKFIHDYWQLLLKKERTFRGNMEDRGWKVAHQGNDRTAYIIGLFGSGRWYINDLIVQSIGRRAKYFRDAIRVHPGPTSMIYSGHATVKYPSRYQALPEVTCRIFEAVRSGIADSIFICRHPLDSLLTNWIWWRTYIRENRWVSGISQTHRNTDELCTELETNFAEFRAFARGDPDFLARMPGMRFLSFPEFVEETELHVQSATLTLRLEEFKVDPLREFSRIAQVMSVELDLKSLRPAPPRTTPYRHMAVRENVRQFRDFIAEMDAGTRRRIESIGYDVP